MRIATTTALCPKAWGFNSDEMSRFPGHKMHDSDLLQSLTYSFTDYAVGTPSVFTASSHQQEYMNDPQEFLLSVDK